MAKGNLILGMGRGKLGDIVLSRVYGQQISRARAKVVKNPRTKGQQVQRIILATVTKAYSQMKSIVNHSWQGISYGAASMKKFNQLNMEFLRNQLAGYGLDNDSDRPLDWAWFIAPENQLAVPNRWAISRGTLPSLGIQYASEDPEDVKYFRIEDSGFDAGETISYADFVEKVGINEGDQITLCVIDFSGKFHYGRFIASPKDGNMTHSVTDTQYFNERNMNITLRKVDSTIQIACSDIVSVGETCVAGGLILSRKQGTTWQRSNSDMIIWNRDFAGIADSMNDALFELETGALDFARPYYLNNANQQNSASSEGGKENP